jgi:hypothetical protein
VSAILLNGVLQTANGEIGVPRSEPQLPTSISEFRFITAVAVIVATAAVGPVAVEAAAVAGRRFREADRAGLQEQMVLGPLAAAGSD